MKNLLYCAMLLGLVGQAIGSAGGGAESSAKDSPGLIPVTQAAESALVLESNEAKEVVNRHDQGNFVEVLLFPENIEAIKRKVLAQNSKVTHVKIDADHIKNPELNHKERDQIWQTIDNLFIIKPNLTLVVNFTDNQQTGMFQVPDSVKRFVASSESTITEIGAACFVMNNSLESVDLSNLSKVIIIKSYFLYFCRNLIEVMLPPNVISVDLPFLTGCYKLQRLKLNKISNSYLLKEKLFNKNTYPDLKIEIYDSQQSLPTESLSSDIAIGTMDLVIANDISEVDKDKLWAIGASLLQALIDRKVLICTKSLFLHIQKNINNGLLKQDYVCKELNEYFVLFVPKDDKAIPKQFYQDLSDWDYTVNPLVTNENIFYLGKKLLNALYHWKNEIQKVSQYKQPFVNVYLNGHGDPNRTAEISIEQDSQGHSDFLDVMNFFNDNLRTKTLAISSCYTSGKKNIDAYNLQNKFANYNVEHLKYTIINMGVLYSPTYSFLPVKGLFTNYFAALNENPANYAQAVQSPLFANKIRDNFASIRLPGTSWFTPVQYDKSVMSLSQVAMSTATKAIIVPEHIAVLILGANYISRFLMIENGRNVVILPSNYHNQNYYIESCFFKNYEISKDISDIYKNIFLGNDSLIKEQVHIYFGTLTIGSAPIKTYEKVMFFSGLKTKDKKTVAGYAYVDNNEVKMHIISGELDTPISLDQYNRYIDLVKKYAMKSVSAGLQEQFRQKLDHVVQNAYQKRLPEKIERSVQEYNLQQDYENILQRWGLPKDTTEEVFQQKVNEYEHASPRYRDRIENDFDKAKIDKQLLRQLRAQATTNSKAKVLGRLSKKKVQHRKKENYCS